ncbi:MAG: hypothetical protein HC772_05275 [Leptolyngbyaceae cyanobacterium CRU_2_3]|nr:hypothetical protein [Leptolyngbyaceae cyanobacterium CRU_2_3]
MAQQLHLPQQIAATQLSLGNAYTNKDISKALDFYQQVIHSTGSATTQIQAQLNRLNLLTDIQRKLNTLPASPEITALIDAIPNLLLEITAQIDRLPPGRPAIYARINFAHHLMAWNRLTLINPNSSPNPNPSPGKIIPQLLATAIQQAKTLQDTRAESFAQGNLGEWYEQQQQWAAAQQEAMTALQLAQQSMPPI